MEEKDKYKEIDNYEQAILKEVNISRDQYRISNMKHFNVHYLEFNWQKKDGPTVILLHGYGGSGITFFKIIPGKVIYD
jgi:pimeloyl-ACP methyl ester carboxylesterase